MKNLCVLSLLFSFSIAASAQTKLATACGLTVEGISVRKLVGNTINLHLKFTNRSGKTIDNIEFNVDFYDIYKDYLTSKEYTWEPGLFSDPIKPNTWIDYNFPDYINEKASINNFVLTIKRIHFTDDSMCAN